MEVEARRQTIQDKPQTIATLLAPIQHTLGDTFVVSGVGLHTGESVQVRVGPAAAGQGRFFVRTDLPTAPVIPASVNAVCQTILSTELGSDNVRVRTVEHLLAALVGMGVDNARIELEGPEAPLLDGSAKEWTDAISHVGIVSQSTPRECWTVSEPVWVREGDAFVAALPSPDLRFTYGIDFDLAAIGNQWQSWSPAGTEPFEVAIAPARTFGLAHQIHYLQAQGLIKGGSLDNALVCSSEGWLNPPLRFANEPARHKLLDLVGDLSLLGTIPTAHFLAYKASHALHTQLARLLNELRSLHP
ncbi:UDP-3-O-(3-hydroxymyristoyl) N-acetylglucosamine deacetylase [Leptolyngbyaceae cyanobacterium JSC-12]|nr:UDP-3-O-(3-hydroxymyristoyl) N-acetylglucosamine deacetylase [Leptolyngbyaceae cyanobacterium JSC-12]